jgi:hypothetical protein
MGGGCEGLEAVREGHPCSQWVAGSAAPFLVHKVIVTEAVRHGDVGFLWCKPDPSVTLFQQIVSLH